MPPAHAEASLTWLPREPMVLSLAMLAVFGTAYWFWGRFNRRFLRKQSD